MRVSDDPGWKALVPGEAVDGVIGVLQAGPVEPERESDFAPCNLSGRLSVIESVSIASGRTVGASPASVRGGVSAEDLEALYRSERDRMVRLALLLVGSAADAEESYAAQDYTYPTCFVVGSEGEGLGRRVASFCDVLVSLPQAGRVSSLNVSVSAGILLYDAVRQRNPAAGGQAGPRPGGFEP